MGIFGDKFEGITLVNDLLVYKMEQHPVAGAVARVEQSADIRKRVTAARLATIGIFAFAAKKQVGHVYLTVEGSDYDFMVEIPVKKEADARKFASKINAAGRRSS